MKTRIIVAAGIVAAALSGALPQAAGQAPAFRADRVLVKYKATNGVAAAAAAGGGIEALKARIGARVHRRYPRLAGVEVLSLDRTTDPMEAIKQLKQSGAVEYAEPDFIVQAEVAPNDPDYGNGSMWGLHNTGQRGGANDADIDAPEAWDTLRDAPGIIVAVIDTGIRYTHEDLAANMWRNPGEVAANGVDDDGNGLIDDIFGINAVNGTGDPFDDQSHGSHCAGTIGAVGNNGKGISGVAWRVQLMACKFMRPTPDGRATGSISDALECVNYAVTKGAHILSNSWGGGGFSQAFSDGISAARARGIIFVAAAGNDGKDNDGEPHFPSNYTQDNVISVANTSRTDALNSGSNFGRNTVDIAAPGTAIRSTIHTSDSAYAEFTGTSMSTPHVAGALALIKARFPSDTYVQLIQRLYNAADPLAGLDGRCTTGGRLNLNRALGGGSISRPLNDPFAAAITIPQSRFTVSGGNANATKEPGEPNHGGNAGSASVWWKWTAAGNGPTTFDTVGSSFDTLLGVYTGAAVGALNLVAGNDDTDGRASEVSFDATAGTTYWIAVDGFSGATGNVTLNGEGPSGVVNDNFAAATLLTGATFNAVGTNVGATREAGEPQHAAGNAGGGSVWWRWTAPAGGPVTIKTLGSSFDTLLGVYTGAAVNALALVANNDDTAGTTSEVTFTALAGTTYRIAVDGYNAATGSIALQGAGPAAPRATVTVAASDPGAGEGGGDPGAFQITRSGGPAGALTVQFTITGTALNGVDLSSIQGSATIASGAASATLAILPIDDSIIEESETVTLTVDATAAYNVGSPASGTVTISDNDTAASVTVQAADATATEGSSDSAAFTVRRSGSTAAPLSVNIQLSGSAANGADYASIAGPLAFAAGVNAVTAIDDAFAELPETVVLTAVAGGGYVLGAPASASVSINDNDATVNNDQFAGRAALSGSDFSTSGSTAAATKESGEPNHAGITGGKSVWYRWTASAGGAVTLDTFGSNFDTLLAVYTGSNVAALTPIASNDDALGTDGVNSELTFTAAAGTTYQIAIDGFQGAAGDFVLNGSAPGSSPPSVTIEAAVGSTEEGGGPRGAFVIARTGSTGAGLDVRLNVAGSAENGVDYAALPTLITIPVGADSVSVFVTPTDDTEIEGDETVAAAIAASAGYAAGAPASASVTIVDDDVPTNNDAFADAMPLAGASFRATGANTSATKEPGEPDHGGSSGGKSLWWTWTAPRSGSVVISTVGSSFDTLLGVYIGDALDELEEVAQDDDSGLGLTSEVSFFASAGATYRLAVDGFNADSGDVVLATIDAGGGENDDFAERIDLGDRSFAVAGTNADATREIGEPEPGVNDKSVWWTWTPGASGPALINTRGSRFDTVLAVFTGESLETLTEVAINDDFQGLTSRVAFEAQAGTTYQIAVGSFRGAGGRIRLQGSVRPFARLGGGYTGLLEIGESDTQLGGTLALQLTTVGRFSGALLYNGRRFALRGAFNELGQATLTLRRGGSLPPLVVALRLDVSSGTQSISGEIIDDALGTTVNIYADRATFHPLRNPAPQAGAYTLLILPPQDQALPQGLGHGAFTLSAAGAGRFVGALGDGVKVAQGVTVSRDGFWPFFVPLAGGRGSLSGYMFFQDRPGESDIDGGLRWVKPATPHALYPAPFRVLVAAVGSHYARPVRARALDLTDTSPNAVFEFSAADFGEAPPALGLTLLRSNRVVGPAGFSLQLNAGAGVFTGVFRDPLGRPRAFGGALFQKGNFGAGAYRTGAAAGSIFLVPAL